MPSIIREESNASGSLVPLKQRNQRGIPLFTNFKRKKKNSKRILAIHMVKGNINIIVARNVIRNYIRNNTVIKIIDVKKRIIKKAF